MITIIKGPMKIERSVNDIKSCSETNDGGYYIKFGDDTEIIFNGLRLTNTQKTMLVTLERSISTNIVINFNDLNSFVSFTN